MGILGLRQLIKLVLLKYIQYVRTLVGLKGERECIKTMKQNIHLDLGYTVQWVR